MSHIRVFSTRSVGNTGKMGWLGNVQDGHGTRRNYGHHLYKELGKTVDVLNFLLRQRGGVAFTQDSEHLLVQQGV